MRKNRKLAIIEKIERTIERMEPGTVVKVDNLTKKYSRADIKEATIMLLNKYGMEQER